MSVLTQGTQVYFHDPDSNLITEVQAVTSFVPGGAPAGQIDDTSLKDTIKKYKRGLRDPGQATVSINADPSLASHIRIHEMAQSDTIGNVKWFVGWSDGTDAPTIDGTTGDIVLPTTRTWYEFEGYVADFPLDFSTDSIVTTQAAIQRSGKGTWTKKA